MTCVIEPEIRQFEASDGYVHRYRDWAPAAGLLRGHVVALHGIQSHSGWYEYSSRELANSGYAVHFLDRRGSGLNQSERGHAASADRLIRDVAEFLQYVRHVHLFSAADRPLILMSVSWGGKLATVTAAKHPELVDALALLYPGLVARIDVRWTKKLRIGIAALTGKLRHVVDIPLNDPALFTSQPKWQAFIRDDPLALKQATISFLLAHRSLSRQAIRAVRLVCCPVLLMLSGQDRIVHNEAVKNCLRSLSPELYTIFEYAQAQHTLEFEPNRHQFLADLKDWLDGVCYLPPHAI